MKYRSIISLVAMMSLGACVQTSPTPPDIPQPMTEVPDVDPCSLPETQNEILRQMNASIGMPNGAPMEIKSLDHMTQRAKTTCEGWARFADGSSANVLFINAAQDAPLTQRHIEYVDAVQQREKMQAEQDERARRSSCMLYGALAEPIDNMRQDGMSYEFIMNYAVSKAYGAYGQAYQSSEDDANLMIGLVKASYSDPARWVDENGNPTRNFGNYARAVCLAGHPFPADFK